MKRDRSAALVNRTAVTGTTWVNYVPSSENIRHLNQEGAANGTNGQWVDSGYDALPNDIEIINGVPAMGVSIDSVNGFLRHTAAPGDSIDTNILVAALVKPVIASGNTFLGLGVSATNGIGSAVGGTSWFDIENEVYDSFVAINAGSEVSHGIEVVGNGLLVWTLIDCGGDATFGSTVSIRPGASAAIGDSVATAPDVGIYLTGCMQIISTGGTTGPSGLTQYIPTEDI